MGHALLVEDPTGRVVAMGNLVWDGDGARARPARRGRLAAPPARHRRWPGGWPASPAGEGAPSVRAVIHSSNTPMVRIMSALGQRLHREYDGGLLTLIATLPRDDHR